MITKAQELIDAYSGLSVSEQVKFDKKHASLKKFSKNLRDIAVGKLACVMQDAKTGMLKLNCIGDLDGKTFPDTDEGREQMQAALLKAGFKKFFMA